MGAPRAARARPAPAGPPAARRPPVAGRWRRTGWAATLGADAAGAGRCADEWRLGGASDGSFLQAGPSSISRGSDGKSAGGARRPARKPGAPQARAIMESSMVIRPAEAGDAEAVAAIYN